MKGIVLAGGAGTRLHPLTLGTSKQLLPIFDKPMIYYPISVLMEAGINEILIISTPQDLGNFKRLLGDGSQFGLDLTYAEQPTPDGLAQAFIIGESFIGSDDVCLILGDNLFYGSGLQTHLKSALNTVSQERKAVVFASYVRDPRRYGVVNFNEQGDVLKLEEKPSNPTSNFAVVGLYFYPNSVIEYSKNVKPSKRGEFEITSVNQDYLETDDLKLEVLAKGFAWLDTGTHESLMEATEFVKALFNRTGQKIACLEELGVDKGWVSKEEVLGNIKDLKGAYYEYIRRIL